MLKRVSERLPLTELFNGTLPKLEPMLDPAFLSRQKGVRSMKPIGTTQTLPSLIYAGVTASGPASQGLPGAPPAGACGRGIATGIAATGRGAMGMIGVVEATWPMPLNVPEADPEPDFVPSAFSSSAC